MAPDDSLEVQLAVLKEQVKALRQIVESASFLSKSIHDNSARLDVHDERFRDLDQDIAAMEARLETTVSRVEKSCNDLGALIRSTAERQEQADKERAVLMAKQEGEEKAEDQRRNLLYGVAGAFMATAFGVLAHLAGLV